MDTEARIIQLPAHVANKIAAGEVVERPASVVKELLENAIDAGATHVTIETADGGRTLIGVHDDGCGMNRADALLCLERQATSKIKDVDDIERINTLGFRGEAIPSIASVSRFLLRTRRPQDDVGTEIAIAGGKVLDVKDAGTPPGTTVEVRDLFFNVPARRKFLRAYATENARIRATFILNALAHPDIGLILKSDGRELYRLPAGATLEERIAELLDIDLSGLMRPVDATYNGIRIHGWIGHPTFTRGDRSEYYTFINNRPASAAVINYAVSAAYPKTDNDTKPILILFIDLPPEDLDVNVHPAKREVRFRKPNDLRDALCRAISNALTQHHPAQPVVAPETPSIPTAEFELPPIKHPYISLTQPAQPSLPVTAPTPASTPDAFDPFDLPPSPDTPQWKHHKILGLAGGRYILLETDTGYITLDPRAAYERIVYDTLIRRTAEAPVPSQTLLIPETLQLPPTDAARLRSFLDAAQTMGFQIADMGSDRFMIDAVPAILQEVSARELLITLATDLAAETKRGSERWREEVLAKAAGRAAAGFHKTFDARAIEELLRRLLQTQMPYTCPKGRPTMLLTSWRELARRFGRD